MSLFCDSVLCCDLGCKGHSILFPEPPEQQKKNFGEVQSFEIPLTLAEVSSINDAFEKECMSWTSETRPKVVSKIAKINFKKKNTCMSGIPTLSKLDWCYCRNKNDGRSHYQTKKCPKH